jgi:hypothetical protein
VKSSLCFNCAPRYEGVLGKWRYSSTHSWPQQFHVLADLPLELLYLTVTKWLEWNVWSEGRRKSSHKIFVLNFFSRMKISTWRPRKRKIFSWGFMGGTDEPCSCFQKSAYFADIKIFNSLPPDLRSLRIIRGTIQSSIKRVLKYSLLLLCWRIPNV